MAIHRSVHEAKGAGCGRLPGTVVASGSGGSSASLRPNIIHTNSLNENVMDIQEKDRFDVVLANPPFGGGERREVQQNFPIKSGETAYLFLQHFIRKLRSGGQAAIVIKNTFLVV